MSKSSITALKKQISSGKKDSDAAYILDEIMVNDSTIENLRAKFTMQYSTITARLSDLEDLGVIYIKHQNKDKRLSVYSYEDLPAKQESNRADREKKRFVKWQKKAKDFGRFLEPELIKKILTLI